MSNPKLTNLILPRYGYTIRRESTGMLAYGNTYRQSHIVLWERESEAAVCNRVYQAVYADNAVVAIDLQETKGELQGIKSGEMVTRDGVLWMGADSPTLMTVAQWYQLVASSFPSSFPEPESKEAKKR